MGRARSVWNTDVVVPAFRQQLSNAVTNQAAALDDICAGGKTLTRPDYFADVNISGGMPFCAKIKTYCLGSKADGEEEAPPWDGDTAADADAGGGCDVNGGGRGATMVLLGAIAIVLMRRASRR